MDLLRPSGQQVISVFACLWKFIKDSRRVPHASTPGLATLNDPVSIIKWGVESWF